MKRITVLLADDHMIVREGFRKLLELEDDLDVVGEAQDGRKAVAMAIGLHPDVILMDIAMPRLNGIEATRQILKAIPEAKILILSAHNDDAYVRSANESGAMGFLLKQSSGRNVCTAVRKVYRGETFFSTAVAIRLRRLSQQSTNNTAPVNNRISKLTSRETEVLQMIAEGKANKETAADLGISVKTVEKHRGSLMRKLDIHDTASLTRYAISSGIIENRVQLTII